MLQSLPVHLEWHSHLPRSTLKTPCPEQSGRHWYKASLRLSQFGPIQPMSQTHVASWQLPRPLHVGSTQSPAKIINDNMFSSLSSYQKYVSALYLNNYWNLHVYLFYILFILAKIYLSFLRSKHKKSWRLCVLRNQVDTDTRLHCVFHNSDPSSQCTV